MWTYASGNNDNNTAYTDETTDGHLCPCATVPESLPYTFVHDNYYCESGSDGGHVNDIYMSDALWDGSQCDGADDNCYAEADKPWFYRQFPVAHQSNVEAMICADE